MISNLCKNPFKFFFPLAIFCFLYASGLWISFGIFEYGDLPLQEHANLFLGGFLYFSILGFLLTAIPRFTSTDFMSRGELFPFFAVAFSVLACFFIERQDFFWLSLFCGWPLLLWFGGKRFLARKQNPPFTFIFVAMGLLLGLSGSFINFLANYNENSFGEFEVWGKLFFYDAMVMSFILGVGGRLIPGILGFTDIVIDQRNIYEKKEPFLKVIPFDIYISLFIFIASFIFECLSIEKIAFAMRAVVVTYFSFKYWRIHEKVKTGKWHGRMLKLSCLFVLIPSWILLFFPDHIIHVKHLIYIGSYCLMTFMVSGRVIVAHGNESLDVEHRKFPYLLVGALFTLAALTRATAPLLPESYFNHLGYAGFVLFVTTLIWSIFFFRKL